MSRIINLRAFEILDSRGTPTVEVDVITSNGVFTASVPSGKSTGKHEAVELRDGKNRYQGRGVRKAVKNVEQIIAPRIIGIPVTKQHMIDSVLISLDGTANKSKLGANTLLAISIAVCKAGAASRKIPLYAYINTLLKSDVKMKMPQAYFNILNGGVHAGNTLPIQEFMISPKMKSFSENLRVGSFVYQQLRKGIVQKYGTNAIGVGDEGGFAPPITNAHDALTLITSALKKSNLVKKVDIALDCAASEFYLKKEKKYTLGTKKYSAAQLLVYYKKLIDTFGITSIEDPFFEESFSDYASLLLKEKIKIVGDDLTVTQVGRIQRAIKEKSCNCLLLKMNQVGTISETLDAVRLAYDNNWNVMVSHRSGETTDTFIADLAVGIGCGAIKAGAPARGERVAKYNRLLRIEQELKEK
jgi:enolase